MIPILVQLPTFPGLPVGPAPFPVYPAAPHNYPSIGLDPRLGMTQGLPLPYPLPFHIVQHRHPMAGLSVPAPQQPHMQAGG